MGFVASTGKYVAILHDDDMYCPNLLREWKTCLDEHPNAAFVFNAYAALNAQGQTRTVYHEPLARCSPGSILLEAMACGAPVIATTNSGAPDIISHGREGFIVPARDPKAIREKVLYLYEHPQDREQIAHAALQRAQLCGWDHYGAQVADLYESRLRASQRDAGQ